MKNHLATLPISRRAFIHRTVTITGATAAITLVSHWSFAAGTSEQGGWRWCGKCQGMFSSDNPSQGVCPAGGSHDGSTSLHYAAIKGEGASGQQGGWRWCGKCQGMFSSDNPSQGVCPAGGSHNGSKSLHYAFKFSKPARDLKSVPIDPG